MNKIKEFINNLISKIGDKPLHVICSTLITVSAGQFSLLFGIFAGVIAGLAKEAYDEYRYKVKSEGVGWDSEDIKYNILGIVIGIFILLII